MKKKLPVVKVKDFILGNNMYTDDNGNSWNVTTLFEFAKDLKVFNCPVASLYTGCKVWHDEIMSPNGFVYHVKRMMDADITKPIIISDDGFVMDGWHRIARAMYDGRTTVPAVRFDKNPSPDRTKDK